MKEKINPNLILAVGALIIVFFGGRKIFQALGFIEDKEEKQKNEALSAMQNADFWDFNSFLATVPEGANLFTTATTDIYVEKLWDATGVFNDNEEEIYGVFRAMPTKAAISFLAKRFFMKKGQDLYSYLDEYLWDSEMLVVANIVNSKPLYNV